ncbi:MAG: hypothetical protein JST66_16390 [Bacteroidetes bacterium]|nr:hypothetical protein [Bacteroidota bacterium]
MLRPSITTRTATLEVHAPGIQLLRYFSGVTVNADGIREITLAGTTLPPARALIVVIPEGTSFSMDMLEIDHTAATAGAAPLEVLAMVVEDPVFLHASGLYFAYHPPTYRHRVFTELGPAEAWARAELARSGH